MRLRASGSTARRRSSSSARARSPDGSSASRPSMASGSTWSCAPAGCRERARRLAARCSGCAAAARFRTLRACASSRSARRTLRSRQLYGDFLLSSDAAVADATIPPELGETSEYHRPPPAPLVVAEGRAALASAALLARTYRTYAWVWPIGPGDPRLWEVDELVARTERARIELTERSSSFGVDAPVEELREAERAANVAGTRLCSSAGKVQPCCSRSRSSPHAACVAISKRRGDDSRGSALSAGSCGCSAGSSRARSRSSASSSAGLRRSRGRRRRRAARRSAGRSTSFARASCRAVGLGSPWRPRSSQPSSCGSPCRCRHREAAAHRGARPRRGGRACSSSSSRSSPAPPTRSSSRAGRARRCCSCSCSPASSRSLLRSSSRGSFRRSPGSAPTAGGGGLPTRARRDRAGARAGRRSRHGGVPDDRVRSRAARGGAIAPPSSAAIESRRRSTCRTTSSSARTSGTSFASSTPPRSTASTSSPDRAAPRGPSCASRAARDAPSASAASPCSGSTMPRSRSVGVWRDEWADPGEAARSSRRSCQPDTAAEMTRVRLATDRIALDVGAGLVSLAAIVRFGRRVVPAGRARRGTPARRSTRARGARSRRRAVDRPRDRAAAALDRGWRGRGSRSSRRFALRATRVAAREWTGLGGAVARRRGRASACACPLTLQRTSGLRAPQPTDASPPAVLVTPRLAELAGGVGEVRPAAGGRRIRARAGRRSGRAVPGDGVASPSSATASRCEQRSTRLLPVPRARTRCGSTSTRSAFDDVAPMR